MTLYIDTADFGKVRFMLEHRHQKTSKTFLLRPQDSEKILEYLDAFFKASKIRNPKHEIRKIVIHKKNTGSFTGLRIAAAIAQALSLVWQVPVKISPTGLTHRRFVRLDKARPKNGFGQFLR